MDLKLSGLSAVVTGASKGLGFATVTELLQEGANVTINSRSMENLERAFETLINMGYAANKINMIAGDVTDPSDCREIINSAIQSHQKIDILITNSGGPNAGSFESLSIEQWDQAIDLSFKSHLNLIYSSLPYLKESAFPSVLAVTSFTIKYPLDNLILSNSIRAATAALIKSLSIELGKQGIRFNSILPGWTMTDRVKDLLSYRAEKNNTSIKSELENIASTIPLQRMAKPEEFARTAAFLVSPAASYINGVLLPVDGGISKGLF